MQAKSRPKLIPPVRGTNHVVLSGAGGPSNLLFYVLGSTNVAHPLAEWARIGTNRFDGIGAFSHTNDLGAGFPERFFSVEIP